MGNKIKFKRGSRSKLPERLAYGEPAFVSDEEELYIGTQYGNVKLTSKSEIEKINEQLYNNTNKLDYFVRPEQFKIDGEIDDTNSILKAISISNKVIFDNKVYRMNKQLRLSNHTLIGVGDGDIWGNDCRIEFYDMPNVETCVFSTGMSQIENIKFQYKEWNGSEREISGFGANRKCILKNCCFIAFPKNGVLLHQSEKIGSENIKSPYYSTFENCTVAYSKEHGIIIGNGANAITFINSKSLFNGATNYMEIPRTLGEYDGLYLDGLINYLPQGLKQEPQQVNIIGGDFSYNSRYGVNLRHCNDITMIGGYLEQNLGESEINVDRAYGCYILNPLCQKRDVKVTTPIESDELNGNIYTYPNTIIIRGKQVNKNTSFAQINGTNGAVLKYNTDESGFVFDALWGGIHPVDIGDKTILCGKNMQFGTHSPVDMQGSYFVSDSKTEGSILCTFLGNNGSEDYSFNRIRQAFGGYPNEASATMQLRGNSTTSRSINCGGTINTSGADYAEYMIKDKACGNIAKGDICGININGQLTDKFNESISFVIKSTNPSFVGGDVYGLNLIEPLEPKQNIEETDKEFKVRIDKYTKDLDIFNSDLEKQRQKYDRIAFCGQVPVNIVAPIGSYIIPKNENNTIKIDYIENPTFEEYKKCVGKVIKHEDDKSVVIVKTL